MSNTTLRMKYTAASLKREAQRQGQLLLSDLLRPDVRPTTSAKVPATNHQSQVCLSPRLGRAHPETVLQTRPWSMSFAPPILPFCQLGAVESLRLASDHNYWAYHVAVCTKLYSDPLLQSLSAPRYSDTWHKAPNHRPRRQCPPTAQ